jgi:alpha-galactosidase
MVGSWKYPFASDGFPGWDEKTMKILHELYEIKTTDHSDDLWTYHHKESGLAPISISPPVFEIDGQDVQCRLSDLQQISDPCLLANGCTEYQLGGPLVNNPDLSLEIIFRVAPANPVVRFRYRLVSRQTHLLSKKSGDDRLCYAGFTTNSNARYTEIVLSDFIELTHAYTLAERPISHANFVTGLKLTGPILAAQTTTGSILIAYEHGSTLPNTYVHFRLDRDVIWLEAAKGNYFHNQRLDPTHPYETIWMQLAATPGDLNNLAAAYRSYILDYFSLSNASRQPFIFYNTWNFQERNFHWNKKPYLESINTDRILTEIDAAHDLGIDVFVIDTGWFSKTGDWQVDPKRFPQGIKPIKDRLDRYGMQLGLWFNPLAVAVTSQMSETHRDCVMVWDGKEVPPSPVWETEDSQPFCLATRYADSFADELIRINRELGVTYFKWDGIQQSGCSSPIHNHGDLSNSDSERAACYEFQMVNALVRIAEKVSSACPNVIIDLDLTESGRCMGLAFLSVGKFFLINNGPYYANYDLPMPGTNENMFFFPGPTRPTICRSALAFDKWLPSILFLTHYFPDDSPDIQPRWCQPEGLTDSPEVNVASLILGQNGIWGDLPNLSISGKARFAEILGCYKQVRGAITQASPVRFGSLGSNPEIYEKLTNEQGVIVIFSSRRGTYWYTTENQTGEPFWFNDNVAIKPIQHGRSLIEVTFKRPGAKIIFFH